MFTPLVFSIMQHVEFLLFTRCQRRSLRLEVEEKKRRPEKGLLIPVGGMTASFMLGHHQLPERRHRELRMGPQGRPDRGNKGGKDSPSKRGNRDSRDSRG